jgi:hypothetical protein
VFEHDEWEDTWRAKIVFGPNSDIRKATHAFFTTHFSKPENFLDPADAVAAADQLLDDVRDVLTAKGNAIYALPYPFVYDLVGNTICADLLDYVQRDMYFSGLTESFGKRFLRYLAVAPTEFEVPPGVQRLKQLKDVCLKPFTGESPNDGTTAFTTYQSGSKIVQCRVVLMHYRYNKRQASYAKDNILPEAIDLVRRRKLVAEKLYFHPTKLIATAMLSAAAHASGLASAEKIWSHSDSEVLKGLESGDLYLSVSAEKDAVRRARARVLSGRLLRRDLLKPIYRVGYHPDIENETGRRLWHRATGGYRRFSNPGKREELIAVLERIIGLYLHDEEGSGIGTVAISCPDRKMQLKEFDMLVLPRPDMEEIKRLQQTVRPTISKEIEVIQTAHQELWRLEVFIGPEVFERRQAQHQAILTVDSQAPVTDTKHVADEFLRRLAGAIEWEVGLPNELTDFFDAIPQPAESLLREMQLERELVTYRVRDRITNEHYRELVRGIAAFGVDSIRSHLIDMKYIDE